MANIKDTVYTTAKQVVRLTKDQDRTLSFARSAQELGETVEEGAKQINTSYDYETGELVFTDFDKQEHRYELLDEVVTNDDFIVGGGKEDSPLDLSPGVKARCKSLLYRIDDTAHLRVWDVILGYDGDIEDLYQWGWSVNLQLSDGTFLERAVDYNFTLENLVGGPAIRITELEGMQLHAVQETIYFNIYYTPQNSGINHGVLQLAVPNPYKESGGSGGTTNYNALTNKPQINNVELAGNKTTADLGLVPPVASASTSGTIKVGDRLSIDANGVLSADIDDAMSSSSTNPVQNKIINAQLVNIDNQLNNKVDKVAGKQLSTEDYTTADKVKLSGIEDGAEVNVNPDWNAVAGDAQILNKPTSIAGYGITDAYTKAEINIALDTKVDKVQGKQLSTEDFTTAFKNKLTGIEDGAEVNVNADWNATSGDAEILNKPTTIAGYGITDAYTKTEVDAKVASVYKYRGSVQTYSQLPSTDLVVGDVYNIETADPTHDIQAGDNVAWTGSSWDKLAGTVDLSAYETAAQAEAKYVAKVAGKGLSTNDYTDADKTKLAGIETGAQVNVIETIKKNGTAINPINKAVDITVPTKVSDIINDLNFIDNTVNNLTNYTTTTALNTLLAGKISEPTTEGTAGQVLTTNGNGVRSWTSMPTLPSWLTYNIEKLYKSGSDLVVQLNTPLASGHTLEVYDYEGGAIVTGLTITGTNPYTISGTIPDRPQVRVVN